MIEFNRRAPLHLVLKRTELVGLSAATRAEVALLPRLVLRVALLSEGRSRVVGLVSVRDHLVSSGPARLGQSPPREILLV